MTKHLRVQAADRTDTGRRRANNQDNLARRIPDDPQELDRSGALFVVADGMGGHAAGEIASRLAVETIPDAYFEATEGDVLQGLAQAIKRANEKIYSVARENTEHSGMGTTLVAAVICQGILYVANIGDSRAYLVRNGKLRQLTEDHSWVAEQVRAGVLSEEQARAHVHRNVITRSLGTQPSVIADVFVEPTREGDILMLCSDGLHGYVSDELIAKTVLAHDPETAVKTLVDLANEAGGPDNITVSIIRIEEIPEASPELLERLQLLKDQPRPTKPMPIVASPEKGHASIPKLSGTLVATAEADQKSATSARRLALNPLVVRLIAVASLIIFLGAAWAFALQPFLQSRTIAARINNDIAIARTHQQSPLTKPTDQLALLAADQQRLNDDLKLNISSTERSQIRNALDTYVAPAVKQAVTAYNNNSSALIVPLGTAQPATMTLNCPGGLSSPLYNLTTPTAPAPPTGSPPPTETPAPTIADPLLYGLDSQHHVTQLTVSGGTATCSNAFPIGPVVDLSAWGDTLYFLADTITGVATPGVYAINQLNPTTLVMNIPTPPANTSVKLLAYSPSIVAVASHTSGAQGDVVAFYSGTPFEPAKPIGSMNVPQGIRSMSLGVNGLLYLLLDDGALATAAPSSTSAHPVGGLTLLPPLDVIDPSQYNLATPIPSTSASHSPLLGFFSWGTFAEQIGQLIAVDTPTPSPTVPPPTPTPLPTGSSEASTLLTSATSLAIDGGSSPRVAVTDAKLHRVVTFDTSGIDLKLIQQYVDTPSLDTLVAASFSTNGKTLYLITKTELIEVPLA